MKAAEKEKPVKDITFSDVIEFNKMFLKKIYWEMREKLMAFLEKKLKEREENKI